MGPKAGWTCGLLLAALSAGAAQAADLTVRVDAREVASKRVHTELTLAVKPGPLTLVYAKWMPGEHGPTGPLESMIGLEIKADGARLSWSRDPLDMYALRVAVPPGVRQLEVSMESGLATEGAGFTAAPTSSAQLAILSWNQFLLFPKGVDADKVSVSASVIAPPGWTVVCALESQAKPGGTYEFEASSLARLIDSPVQMGLYAKLVELTGSDPLADIKHRLSFMADSAAALAVPGELGPGYSRLVAENGLLFGSRMYRHYTWLVSLSAHRPLWARTPRIERRPGRRERAARSRSADGFGGTAWPRIRPQLERQIPSPAGPVEPRLSEAHGWVVVVGV